jgi:putative SOS response-associated peptidase YedK
VLTQTERRFCSVRRWSAHGEASQPVILEPRDYEEWLEPTERPPVHLLRVFPDEEMKMMPIDGDAVKGSRAGRSRRQ